MAISVKMMNPYDIFNTKTDTVLVHSMHLKNLNRGDKIRASDKRSVVVSAEQMTDYIASGMFEAFEAIEGCFRGKHKRSACVVIAFDDHGPMDVNSLSTGDMHQILRWVYGDAKVNYLPLKNVVRGLRLVEDTSWSENVYGRYSLAAFA